MQPISGSGSFVAVVCACSIAWLAGCAGEEQGSGPVAPAPALAEEDVARALDVYEEQSCGTCHGDDAEGSEAGPVLQDLAPYWSVDRIVTYLENPERFRAGNPDFDARRELEYEFEMPDFSHLSEDDRRLLAAWLLER